MDVKAYISTGILETYVMGHCSPDQIREVEEFISLHPEIKDEVASIRLALESYAMAFSKTPPADLKDKIWSALDGEGLAHPSKVISINRPQAKQSNNWLVAASLVLFAIAASMNFFLYSKWKSAERKIAEIEIEKEYFASQLEVQNTSLAVIQEELAVMQLPGTKMIVMKGTESHPGALATIFWNTESKDVFLKVKNLPEIPQGKQYQLWAIVDGAPVNAGLVAIEEQLLQKMEQFSSAQAFAITLEPLGGSSSPTLEKMYVIGNI